MRIKRAAIIQSCYIPWKGYFDMIGSVDEFILYDDVQYSRSGWRNRNQIKTRDGVKWLTIPVSTAGRFGQRIRDTEVRDGRWAGRHWSSILTYYARAPFFESVAPVLKDLYDAAGSMSRLSEINELFIREICHLLGIRTRLTRSMDLVVEGDRVGRLISLCQQVGAGEYLSGPAAQHYLDVARLAEHGIAVRWMDYAGYPEYAQLHGPPFVHEVTILDLILNQGPECALDFMLSGRDRSA